MALGGRDVLEHELDLGGLRVHNPRAPVNPDDVVRLQDLGGAYTFTSGLTNTAGVVTGDYITGKAGGQTWGGGTNTGDPLTIKASLAAQPGILTLVGSQILASLVPAAIPSAAGATWDALSVPGATVAVSGSTGITTATGFNYVSIGAPTINGTAAITNAATVTIGGAPGGTAPIVNPMAFWVRAGQTNLAGPVKIQALTGLLKATAGIVGVGAAGTDYEVPLTFTSGLTRTSNTVTGDYITGKTGDQTWSGSSDNTGNLTIKSNNSGATYGSVNMKSTTFTVSDDVHSGLAISTSVTSIVSAYGGGGSHLYLGAGGVTNYVQILTTGTVTFTNLAGTGSTLTKVDGSGLFSRAAAGTDYESPLIFSTGLTRNVNTITADLSTGKGSAQTAYGATTASGNLTLSSTFNATKGSIFLGTSTYDENANTLTVLSASAAIASPTLTVATSNGLGYAGIHLKTGTSALKGGFRADSAGNMAAFTNGGAWYFLTGGDFFGGSVRQKIFTNGNVLVANVSAGTDPSDIGAQFGTTGTAATSQITVWNSTPATMVTATALTWDAHSWNGVTATLTGTTRVSTAGGLNFAVFKAPTITDASAVTVDQAATLTVIGAPIAAGSVTITNPFAFWVQSGTTKFSGTTVIQTLTGILKGSSGVVGTAVAGTDYQAPLGPADATISFPTSTTIKVGTLTNKFVLGGTTDAQLTGAQSLGALATGIVKNTTTTGVLSIAAAGTDYEVPLTFASGLTRSGNTVRGDYITGVALSGGQTTWTGGTGNGEGIILQSTSAGTKGKITFGTTGAIDDNQKTLTIGATSYSAPLGGRFQVIGAAGAVSIGITDNANSTISIQHPSPGVATIFGTTGSNLFFGANNVGTYLQISTSGSITMTDLAGTGSAVIKASAAGLLSRAVSGTDYEAGLTFSTGLTRVTNTITANLSTGIAGSQTAAGGNSSTASANLTLASTLHATKGNVIFDAAGFFDGANKRLIVGATTYSSAIGGAFQVVGPAAGISGAFSDGVNSTIQINHPSNGVANIYGTAGVGINFGANGTTNHLQISTAGVVTATGRVQVQGQLGVGSTTPISTASVHIDKAQNQLTELIVSNNNTGGAAGSWLLASLNNASDVNKYLAVAMLGTSYTASGLLGPQVGLIQHTPSVTANMVIWEDSAADIIFATTTSLTERMRIANSGRILMNTAVATADADGQGITPVGFYASPTATQDRVVWRVGGLGLGPSTIGQYQFCVNGQPISMTGNINTPNGFFTTAYFSGGPYTLTSGSATIGNMTTMLVDAPALPSSGNVYSVPNYSALHLRGILTIQDAVGISAGNTLLNFITASSWNTTPIGGWATAPVGHVPVAVNGTTCYLHVYSN